MLPSILSLALAAGSLSDRQDGGFVLGYRERSVFGFAKKVTDCEGLLRER